MTNKVQIGLGTAQIGLAYGNRSHLNLLSEEEAEEILKFASEHGVSFFDTAIAYGESERRIGQFLSKRRLPSNILVSTKIPSVESFVWSNEDRYWDFLKNSIASSLHKLCLPRIELLQFHQCDQNFLENKIVQRLMARLISEGFCQQIGISVYEPDQALAALRIPSVSALQIPVNLLDQRFLAPDLIKLYREKKVYLVARSIFLQGLLSEQAALPQVRKKSELGHLKGLLLDASGSTKLGEIALGYIFHNCLGILDVALLGADNVHSLNENLESIRKSSYIHPDVLESFEIAQKFALEERLLSPVYWN